MDLEEYIERNAEYINTVIDRYFGAATTDLSRASAHLLTAGGKRLRPAVLLLAGESVRKGSTPDLVMAALALELTHTFTLIHDDIMDGDQARRGVTTVHTLWDEATAILAGDVLYAQAFTFICRSRADETARLRAVEVLARTCAEICEGQSQDMSFEDRTDVSEPEYLDMVRKKTGSLYAAAAGIGGLLAGANRIQYDALTAYGENAGIAFQIQDDLIDLLVPPTASGKDQGSDIREGKQTLLAITARKHGVDLSRYRGHLGPDDIPPLIDELDECGALSYVRERAESYLSAAKRALDILPESGERRLLREMADFFVTRRL